MTEDPVLPPQSFSRLEIEALMLAQSGLDQIGDETLKKAGRNAMARIIATLPDRQARQAMHTVMRSWRQPDKRPPVTVDLDLLREACWEEFSLVITYRDLQERTTTREIWPMGLSYSETSLLLLAHCRLRQDYRHFHVSRIASLARGTESFRPNRVGLIRDYIKQRGMTGTGKLDAVKLDKVRIGNGLTSKRGSFGGAGHTVLHLALESLVEAPVRLLQVLGVHIQCNTLPVETAAEKESRGRLENTGLFSVIWVSPANSSSMVLRPLCSIYYPERY